MTPSHFIPEDERRSLPHAFHMQRFFSQSEKLQNPRRDAQMGAEIGDTCHPFKK